MQNYQLILHVPDLLTAGIFSLAGSVLAFAGYRFYEGRESGVTIAGTTIYQVTPVIIKGKYSLSQLKAKHGDKYFTATYVSPTKTKVYFLFCLGMSVIVFLMMFVELKSI